MFGEKQIVNLPAQDVAAYFAKNDSVNLSVPLAVAQQVVDEVVGRLAADKNCDAMALARLQGMIAGVKRFSEIYMAGMKSAEKQKKAGK